MLLVKGDEGPSYMGVHHPKEPPSIYGELMEILHTSTDYLPKGPLGPPDTGKSPWMLQAKPPGCLVGHGKAQVATRCLDTDLQDTLTHLPKCRVGQGEGRDGHAMRAHTLEWLGKAQSFVCVSAWRVTSRPRRHVTKQLS